MRLLVLGQRLVVWGVASGGWLALENLCSGPVGDSPTGSVQTSASAIQSCVPLVFHTFDFVGVL